MRSVHFNDNKAVCVRPLLVFKASSSLVFYTVSISTMMKDCFGTASFARLDVGSVVTTGTTFAGSAGVLTAVRSSFA